MSSANLAQPPFDTTLMGVLRGVASYFGLPASDAALYGGSGHAFVMNIHTALCPSGPYCWKLGGLIRLLRNLGIEMTDLGFFHGGSSPAERSAVEARVRARLGAGEPCSILNMEHQLVTGSDETGLLTAQPWPGKDFPPRHLSFGSWRELGEEIHLSFFSFGRVDPAPERQAVAESLGFAADLRRAPGRHADAPHAVGAGAYAAWIAAVKAGHGGSHGEWWNAMVWSECRARAGEYFAEVARSHPDAASEASRLAGDYGAIADCLRKAGDKKLAAETKVELLERAAALEAAALGPIESLAARLA